MSTRRYAVVGDPVAHSKSPKMHAAAYRALGLPHVYEAVRATAADLPHVVAALRDIAEVEPIVISSVTGDGLRDFRAAVDALAARVVIETRANRPVAEEEVEVEVVDVEFDDDGEVTRAAG